MKILVTGGGGFLGRYIIKALLARKDQVVSLGRRAQPDLESWGVEVCLGDVADSEAVLAAAKGCDAVIHVAAKAGVWGTWESYFQANVLGTRNVLAACREHGIQRLVHTSTPSVVFSGEAFEGADESLPYGQNWLCHYAHTKSIAEREVLEANDLTGLRTTALRPHLIWGVGDNHLIPRIVERARAGKLRKVGSGKNRVDITHVYNAAQAHVLALDALDSGTAAGRAYFLSQGESVNLWDWVNGLLTGLGVSPVEKSISARAAYRIGAVMEVLYRLFHLSGEPPMTRFVAVELAKSHWFDISAAKRDLGYQVEVSTEAGLRELILDLNGK